MRIRRQLKRGELSTVQLIGLIIILFVTALTIYYLTKAKDVIDQSANSNCAAAVREAHFSNKVYGRDQAPDILACQTNYRTIKRTDLPVDTEEAMVAMKQLLAEEMRKCWQQWGSGELDLFDGPGDYCSICSVIQFDEKTQKDIPELARFNQYLRNTKAPDKDGRTYEEVLQGFSTAGSGNEGSNFDTNPGNIDTTNNINIMFWYDKEKQANHLFELVGLTDDYSPADAAKVTGILGGLLQELITSGAGAAKGAATGAKIGLEVGVARAANTGSRVMGAADAARTVSYVRRGRQVGTALGGAGGFVGGALQSTWVGSKIAAFAYVLERSRDDFYVYSATFLLSDEPREEMWYYADKCKQMANPTVSP